MDAVIATRRVEDVGSACYIYLNLPDSVLRHAKEMVVVFSPKENAVKTIRSPAGIRQDAIRSAISRYKKDILEFVEFVEENAQKILSGGLPGDRDVRALFSYRGPLNVLLSAKKRGVSLLACESVSFQAKCGRCSLVSEYHDSRPCGGCGATVSVKFHPSCVDGFLGNLVVSGASLVCFNPQIFTLACECCGKTVDRRIKDSAEVSCGGCGSIMEVRVEKIAMAKKASERGAVRMQSRGSLPERGTCKHYRKSTRWFRFACCKRAYPCDDCHNDDADHPVAAAASMICGKCGTEQAVASSCACGMKISSHTSHWEGGKGNRNRLTMSKKDRKKYANRR